jgi:hypothetical protein
MSKVLYNLYKEYGHLLTKEDIMIKSKDLPSKFQTPL